MIDEALFAAKLPRGGLRIQRTLPGPIERVWAYLVEPEKRRLWLAGGPIEPGVGGRVELLFRHAELSDEPGAVPDRYADMAQGHRNDGRVTVWEPPHRLAFTWGENHGDPSEVSFTLSARGDAVLLTVVHVRLHGDAVLRSVSGGWHTHLDILDARLRGRAPDNFWNAFRRVEAEYARRLAAPRED